MSPKLASGQCNERTLGALCPVELVTTCASLENGHKFGGIKSTSLIRFSYLIVTGTVMLTLRPTTIPNNQRSLGRSALSVRHQRMADETDEGNRQNNPGTSPKFSMRFIIRLTNDIEPGYQPGWL
jgi:hypothetical protein